MSSSQALSVSRPRSTGFATTLIQSLLAAAFGGVLLAGVGFSHIEALHNAAHDTRHSAGFPCH